MIRFDDIPDIYLFTGPTDLRKGIDGYAALIEKEMGHEVFDGGMFVFCNRTRNKIKCLYWDGTGFWLLYKRLEKGRFQWSRNKDGNTVHITHQQLKWLMEGLKIEQRKAFTKTDPKYV